MLKVGVQEQASLGVAMLSRSGDASASAATQVGCQPTEETTQPRPREFWPDGAPQLAEQLIQTVTRTQSTRRESG